MYLSTTAVAVSANGRSNKCSTFFTFMVRIIIRTRVRVRVGRCNKIAKSKAA